MAQTTVLEQWVIIQLEPRARLNPPELKNRSDSGTWTNLGTTIWAKFEATVAAAEAVYNNIPVPDHIEEQPEYQNHVNIFLRGWNSCMNEFDRLH